MAVLFLGEDLADRNFGVDETPIHGNEFGSKCVSTLECEGGPHVALGTNHCACRARLIVMTMVISWLELVLCWNLLVASCANISLDNTISQIELPKNARVSLDWPLCGSFDDVRFLAYLNCWLDPWPYPLHGRRLRAFGEGCIRLLLGAGVRLSLA